MNQNDKNKLEKFGMTHNQIRDLSKNYDRDAQSKILDELTDKFFDVDGIKELYDILMEEVYGDGGIKGY